MIAHSAIQQMHDRAAALRRAGRPVLHLGFGEAGLVVWYGEDEQRENSLATRATLAAPIESTWVRGPSSPAARRR